MKHEQLREIVYRYPEGVMFPFTNLLEPLGFDGLCAIVAELGGARVYIPTTRTMFRECLVNQIREDFNGHNYRELCKTYGYSEKSIRDMTS